MSSIQDESSEVRRTAKSLRNRANMLATCHSVMSDHYRKWDTILLSTILVLSTFSVGVTFISDQFVQQTTGISPNALKWINGLLAILTFAAGLLLSQWRLADKAAEHRTAVRHYFAVLHRIRTLLESNATITKDMLEQLRDEYEDATEGIPKIPDSQFLKLKQYHLQKVAISKELEKTPHSSIKQIRQRLRESEASTLSEQM